MIVETYWLFELCDISYKDDQSSRCCQNGYVSKKVRTICWITGGVIGSWNFVELVGRIQRRLVQS